VKTIMVTGVGAIIGYGLLRSLRAARPDARLIGTDIYPDAVGQAWCDVFVQAPYTASSQYLNWLRVTVEKYHVDLLIPGIEQDVHGFSSNRALIGGFGCKVALNTTRLIDLSSDKWAMHQELAALEDPCRIPSYLVGDYDTLVAQLGLPFILKPRRSYASKGIVYVKCRKDFNAHNARLGEQLMAQPIVGTDDEEYTAAAFGDGDGNVCASIILKRRLAQDGSSSKAWVRKIGSLDSVVSRLCSHFQPVGPTNLQFRRDGENWKLLEINPRVSSTSSIRRAFGYNEAEMMIEYFLEGTLPKQPENKSGFAVRFIEDYVVYDRDNF
jgi:carbamoyl-phosphate synthase large subunit